MSKKDKTNPTENNTEKKSFFEKLKALIIKHREIIAYIIVGGFTTLVRWGTTAILEPLFVNVGMSGASLSFFTTLTSLVITILFAYPPNKLFVFDSKSFKGSIVAKEFAAFISARAAASIIELAGIPLMVQFLRLPNLVATMIVSLVVLVANYIFSKLVVFKKRSTEDNPDDKKRKGKKEIVIEIRPKDKLIALVLTIICIVIAVVSIGAYCVEIFDTVVALFTK